MFSKPILFLDKSKFLLYTIIGFSMPKSEEFCMNKEHMNCVEFKKQMNNFIHNTIDEKIVEEFINHYKNCKECNEELEIYYMINKTFNNDKATGDTVSIPNSFDFKKSLEQKISFYEEMIYHEYKVRFLLRLLYLGTEFVSIAMAVYFIFVFLGGANV